jgi:hypothetical protein
MTNNPNKNADAFVLVSKYDIGKLQFHDLRGIILNLDKSLTICADVIANIFALRFTS